ncbi:hypothetical protein B0A80_06270 [Flavobacterium tructae]|uniref:hypothetical protein n=1 Tax=Flavobacterium tructae TaxID=1114873 RepID=UPI000B5B6ADA|nr:hypothetical protein [Flavobacterium tructae]OXB24297.1 hypothetical protein B0A80_06270 [Flavobacterium tructae]
MVDIQILNSKIQRLLECSVYSIELIEKIEIEINAFNTKESLAIIDLIKQNLKNEDIKALNSILEILYSTYNFDGKEEEIISTGLIETLTELTRLYYEFGNPSIETSYCLIFDIFFHNPGLILEFDYKMKNPLIDEIKKISEIKYSLDRRSDGDLLIALQKIISLSFYFGEEEGKELLETNFLNHFDKFVVGCAKDELRTNLLG